MKHICSAPLKHETYGILSLYVDQIIGIEHCNDFPS